MNIQDIYKKPKTFFTRTRQELIISNIEHEFYQTFSIYAEDVQSLARVKNNLEKICTNICYAITYYYFEDDLLDYLFNVLNFIKKYIEEIKKSNMSKKTPALVQKKKHIGK